MVIIVLFLFFSGNDFGKKLFKTQLKTFKTRKYGRISP